VKAGATYRVVLILSSLFTLALRAGGSVRAQVISPEGWNCRWGCRRIPAFEARLSAALPASIGEIIDGYRLDGVIGQGALGVVYVASHVKLRTRAAVKVLGRPFCRDQELIARFMRESRSSTALRHPNLVGVVGFVDEPALGRVSCVMELVEGPALPSVLARQPLDARAALNAILQLAGALDAAHRVGLVHRDVKPSNVGVVGRLDSDLSQVPSVKLGDFGVPRPTLLGPGRVVLGTPAYLAPEQIVGEDVGPAADVYALGELLYEMLTRERLFIGADRDILDTKLHAPPPSVRLPANIAGAHRISALISALVLPAPSDRPSIDQVRAWITDLLERELRTTSTPAPTASPRVVEPLRIASTGEDDDHSPTLLTADAIVFLEAPVEVGGPSDFLREPDTIRALADDLLPPPPAAPAHEHPPYAAAEAVPNTDFFHRAIIDGFADESAPSRSAPSRAASQVAPSRASSTVSRGLPSTPSRPAAPSTPSWSQPQPATPWPQPEAQWSQAPASAPWSHGPAPAWSGAVSTPPRPATTSPSQRPIAAREAEVIVDVEVVREPPSRRASVVSQRPAASAPSGGVPVVDVEIIEAPSPQRVGARASAAVFGHPGVTPNALMTLPSQPPRAALSASPIALRADLHELPPMPPPLGAPEQHHSLRARLHGGMWKAFAVIFGGAALLAILALLLLPELSQRATRAVSKRVGRVVGKESAVRNPLLDDIERWRTFHSKDDRTVYEHLEEARRISQGDSWRSSEAAEVELKLALSREPNNPRAIALYLENRVLWRGELLSADEQTEMEDALRYAWDRAPDTGDVLRAGSAVARMRGHVDRCQDLAARALEKLPDDTRSRLELAACELDGEPLRAIEEAERVRKASPELREVDRVLARAYANVGRYGSAIAILDERIKSDRNGGRAIWLRADLEAELGRFEEAERFYQLATNAEPENPLPRFDLAAVQIELGKPKNAMMLYKLVAGNRSASERIKGAANLGAARAQLVMGDVERAAESLADAMKDGVTGAQAHLVSADLALARDLLEDARPHAERAVTLSADAVGPLVMRGVVNLASARVDEGLADLRRALDVDPRDHRIRAILVSAALKHRDPALAHATLEEVLVFDPSGQYANAIDLDLEVPHTALQGAVRELGHARADPRHGPLASAALGMLQYALGRRVEAGPLFAEVSSSTTSLARLALAWEVQLALDEGTLPRAEKGVAQLLKVDPTSPVALLLRGRIAARKNNVVAAREAFEGALTRRPEMIGPKAELAALALGSGTKESRETAVASLTQLFREYPRVVRIRQLLAQSGY
jgi:serine/threonine protein kinase/tetratricopeptide (TPR) repeat protein